jgi:IMP dehydrogenase/GMP reductase
VTPFLDRAEEIFATARLNPAEDCEMAILLGRDGGLQLLPSAGWALHALCAEHGAAAGYRVLRRDGRVRVEGMESQLACVLETGEPYAGAGLPSGLRLPVHPQALYSTHPVD